MTKVRSKYTHPDFQFMCFSLDGIEFAVSLKCVKEIIRCRGLSCLEGAPPFVEGGVRLRSVMVPVIDLRKRFSIPFDEGGTSRILVASIDGRVAGLKVDEVRDIISGGKELRPEKGGSRRPWDRCVDAVVETGSGAVRIIDLTRLLTKKERALLDAPIAGGPEAAHNW